MPNPIQKIIALATKNGFVPEKIKTKLDLELSGDFSILTEVMAFNQAIDSYNLEKIIELAYEEVVEEIENLEHSTHFQDPYFEKFTPMGAYLSAMKDVKDLLTSPNKKE